MIKPAIILSILAGLLMGSGASAQSQKPLTILIGTTPSGTYDLYARALARHIPKHLPGTSNVIPQNIAGAGGLRAANYLYNVAPKDGTTIATFARGLAVQPLLDAEGVQFEARKFNWIGSTASEVSVVFAWHDKPFKTIEDLRSREMILPATGSGADSIIFPYIMNGVLGTKFKVIAGYPGGLELQMAVENGEADGIASTSWSNLMANKPDWVRDKKINLIMQLGTTKHPAMGDLPSVMDYAATDADRRILELIFSRQAMAYPFVAPPGVPPERVKALRDAFDAVMRDPEFIRDTEKQHLEVDPMSGADIQALVDRLYSTPPELIERTKAVLEEGKTRTTTK
jgi:tripartite-type tricarboxylate transporter receptor subunit TctC